MLNETLSFPPPGTPGVQCVDIAIINNFAYEKNESFSIHISSEPGVSVPDPYIAVNITDDDGMILYILLWATLWEADFRYITLPITKWLEVPM